MSPRAFCLFDTPIGPCGIAWGDGGVVGLQLPESDREATRRRIRQRFGADRERVPPDAVAGAIGRIVDVLSGRSADLAAIRLDMSGVPPFHAKVYQAARRIPAGMTTSYGDLATRLGSPGAARAVGQALKNNPFAIVVPCHRVLAKNGAIGGFTASGGVATKQRLLDIERGLGDRRPALAP
ncbi:MAG TPA: methylated-DNA--[protein]-cysteine S-methyltransferase [Polyangiaceae bacterium]|nr:methylated-DNA--[protein]-cysteine S-methyltransferase [Polyangiaceae bacterium]